MRRGTWSCTWDGLASSSAQCARQRRPGLKSDPGGLLSWSRASIHAPTSLCSYPGLSDKQQITFGGGSEPLWSADGQELFFRKGADFFAAPVTSAEARLNVGQPIRLFGGAYDDSPTGHQHYDVSRDRQRFALVRKLQGETQSELRVILNWRAWEEAPANGR